MAIPTVSAKRRRKSKKGIAQAGPELRVNAIRNFLIDRVYKTLMIFITLLVIMILIIVSLFDLPIRMPELVPVNLHSLLVADYSADTDNNLIPVLQIGVIFDLLSDLGAPDAENLFSSIQNSLLTPVPTITPLFTLSATQDTPTSYPSTPTGATPGRTNPPASEDTLTPTSRTTEQVSTPTRTRVYDLTSTPVQPTDPPPTKSRVPSTSTPTATRIPPTPTLRPSATATKVPPTVTPKPPQPTNTPNPYPYP